MLFTTKAIVVHSANDEFPYTVRSARKNDADILAAYFQRNRAFLKPWDPVRDESFYTESGWKFKIHHLVELEKLSQSLYFMILDETEQQVLGIISFSNICGYPFHACNLGYSLDEQWQGKGIMKQALTRALQYVFEQRNVHRIQAAFMPHNTKSQRVLYGLGFEQEGFAKDYLLIDGKWQDHVLTSLVDQNWTKKS
ncbi:ribosomal protein S5-alanine N-acetyltransferase [Vibrio gallicus]|uniref:ribosomal protein S5-alanine N-acetyltransferase n=1 Tax=Vibrio gallicus TaxID=190897 RepID=UPI0021C2D742|nr:ribosomal protein S5-alanine N-acetyltransferase [Vibrio gallicus]